MHVRTAGHGDLVSIGRIAHQAWAEDPTGLLAPATATGYLEATYTPGTLVQRIDNRLVLVADDDTGTVVGFAEADVHADHTRLAAVLVDPTRRRRGVATALLVAVRAEALDHPICVDVLLGDLETESFLEARGFVPGEVFESDQWGEPMVERRWWLNSPVTATPPGHQAHTA